MMDILIQVQNREEVLMFMFIKTAIIHTCISTCSTATTGTTNTGTTGMRDEGGKKTTEQVIQ